MMMMKMLKGMMMMMMMMVNSIRIVRMGMTKMYCCDSGYRVTWGGQEEEGHIRVKAKH